MHLREIETLTIEYGEGWAISHVQRVLGLIEHIGSGMAYNLEAVHYAAYLHDWGAFPRYKQPGVDHALRSRQIAETEILPRIGLPGAVKTVILEAIAKHDYRCMEPVESVEALLLREADFLDFLGVVGIAREFAWGPNSLQKSYDRILSRIAGVRGRFTIPAAQALASQRIVDMERFLAHLVEESRGIL